MDEMNVNRFPHWPRGLSRLRAAAYIGVTPQVFNRLVAENKMPRPKRIGHLMRWDKLAIDKAFSLLFGGDGFDESGEEIWEVEAGPPQDEWPILTRRLPD